MISKLNNKTLWVFLFVLSVYLIFFSGHVGGDALWNYYSAESIFEDGNLDLSDSVKEKNVGELTGPFRTIAEKIERLSKHQNAVYSKYGFAQVIIGTVFYGLGLLVITVFPFLPDDFVLVFCYSLQNVFITALLSTVYYSLLRFLKTEHKDALLLTVGLSFGTILITYAVKSGFGEPLAALLILTSFYYIIRFRQDASSTFLLFSGICSGATILTKFYTVLTYPAIFVLLILIIRENSKKLNDFIKPVMLFMSSFFLPVFLFLLYNFVRYDHVLQTGYDIGFDSVTVSSESYYNIMYGLTTFFKIMISPGKGLLLFNPLLVLFFLGFKKLYDSDRIIFYYFVILCISYMLFFSFSTHWASNGAWGARYFVPIIPLMLVPAALILYEKNRIHFFRKSIKFLIIAGITMQVPSALMNFSAFERFLEKESPHSYYTRIDQSHYSQIIGGYYQLISGVNRLITGTSLDYPILIYDDDDIEKVKLQVHTEYRELMEGAFIYKSLAGYDWFDLWYIHVFNNKFISSIIKFITFIVLLFTVMSVIYYGKLLRNLE